MDLKPGHSFEDIQIDRVFIALARILESKICVRPPKSCEVARSIRKVRAMVVPGSTPVKVSG